MSNSKDYLIAPSILSANLAELGADVSKVLDAGGDIIHFDVMDNHYVPNLTFGAPLCKSLRDYGITAPIDVHLMVEPVDDLIIQFANAGASMISFHPEATKHLDRSIELIKSYGIKAGLALNPATSISSLDCILDKCDFILLMTVNPGFGGQKFIANVFPKIKELNNLIESKGLDITIAVDGGVCIDNIAKIAQHGASMFIAGSAIFNSDSYSQTIAQMRAELDRV